VVQLASSVFVIGVALGLQGRALSSPTWRKDALLGLLNPGLSYMLGLAALAHISASLSVLLWATEPLMIVALAWLFLGERNRRVLAPVVVASFGVFLVSVVPGSVGTTRAVLLSLAGVAACAIYTAVSRKLGLADSTAAVIATQQVSALVFAVAVFGAMAIFGRAEFPSDVSAQGWLAAIGSGVLYYAVAFFFYLKGLAKTPASIAGIYLNLIPVFGIAAAFLFLDERLSGRQWFGALLIILAVVHVARAVAPMQGRMARRSLKAMDG
jgi:drug/metabolite transporter (DMT)-like permease